MTLMTALVNLKVQLWSSRKITLIYTISEMLFWLGNIQWSFHAGIDWCYNASLDTPFSLNRLLIEKALCRRFIFPCNAWVPVWMYTDKYIDIYTDRSWNVLGRIRFHPRRFVNGMHHNVPVRLITITLVLVAYVWDCAELERRWYPESTGYQQPWYRYCSIGRPCPTWGRVSNTWVTWNV